MFERDEMKSILSLCFASLVLLVVGCGVQGTPPSQDTGPPPAQEELNKQVEEATQSGKINPATYGKY